MKRTGEDEARIVQKALDCGASLAGIAAVTSLAASRSYAGGIVSGAGTCSGEEVIFAGRMRPNRFFNFVIQAINTAARYIYPRSSELNPINNRIAITNWLSFVK